MKQLAGWFSVLVVALLCALTAPPPAAAAPDHDQLREVSMAEATQPQVVVSGEQFAREQLAREMAALKDSPLDRAPAGGRYLGVDGQLHDANGDIVEGEKAGVNVADYDAMSKEDLQAEADRRKLEVTGTGANDGVLKKDLVDALRLHDGNG